MWRVDEQRLCVRICCIGAYGVCMRMLTRKKGRRIDSECDGRVCFTIVCVRACAVSMLAYLGVVRGCVRPVYKGTGGECSYDGWAENPPGCVEVGCATGGSVLW